MARIENDRGGWQPQATGTARWPCRWAAAHRRPHPPVCTVAFATYQPEAAECVPVQPDGRAQVGEGGGVVTWAMGPVSTLAGPTLPARYAREPTRAACQVMMWQTWSSGQCSGSKVLACLASCWSSPRSCWSSRMRTSRSAAWRCNSSVTWAQGAWPVFQKAMTWRISPRVRPRPSSYWTPGAIDQAEFDRLKVKALA
jgi:hypothetical protein